ETRNRTLQLTKKLSIAEFSASNSQVMLLAVRSDEELAMTFKAQKLLDEKACKASSKLRVPIAASVRHVHLRKETIEQLFGEGVKLTQEKELSQPGQFLADQTVTLVGPEDSIKEVSIVGPPREDDQVEISQTDEFTLGVDAPIRASGEIGHTPGIILCGPEGKVTLSQGVICPLRHIHMSPEDAKRFHVNDGQTVQVEVISSERGLVFRDVLIRVSPNYRLEMHVDTDEANAAGISDGGEGRILAQF
ncbi:MAG: phosphate propanoyltransferase, partial [Bdellovibrionales bacterium]|nr:phosphate propanoyltransferase [Bdellovibrionales bacterium]